MRRIIVMTACAALLVAFGPAPANAQFGKLKDKVKQKIDKKVDEKVDCTLDQYVDSKECQAQKTATGKAPGASTAKASEKAATLQPGEGAWANFDFVPGARPVFVEDFTRDRVGNFPKRLELQFGTFEVVEWEGKRWLRSSNDAEFSIVLPEELPARWTMEFDATIPWHSFYFFPGEATKNGYISADRQSIQLGVSNTVSAGGSKKTHFDLREVFSHDIFGEGSLTPPMRVRVHADDKYMKVYLNEVRVANMPNMGRWTGNQLNFYFRENTNHGKIEGVLLSNISINAGGRDMYDALTADGRLAVQGIYFDTGSDRIRPESSGTLSEISEMLNEHPELKLIIEGHTDNVGDAAANQKLSETRAAAVVQALSTNYKVAADRLKSAGFGAAKPAKPNDTPEGRQANRRVELVVQK
jgi:outer membrane protein OmpA-like peptidoglycan-associated protein